MPKRKREGHRGHGGRKRRREAQEGAEGAYEAGREVEAAIQQQLLDGDYVPFDDDTLDLHRHQHRQHDTPREFFGMLEEEEQEYFRRADELLELNDFPTPEDRSVFLQNVWKEAKGKELKLASSQSCSRLMERLILLSTTAQKKNLFEAFADHFLTLVTHRFGSHCCEQLFLQSASVVTEELSGKVLGPIEPNAHGESEEKEGGGDGAEAVEQGKDAEAQQPPQQPMEDLFLLVLDELEEQLSSLLTDVFGSHTLRVLLTILSGRPLDQLSTKSLLSSKKKEHITLPGGAAASQPAPAEGEEPIPKMRPVPVSFGLAVQKILADTMSTIDSTTLGVMVKHPTGNPILQLLLELDISLNTKSKERKKKNKKGKGGAGEGGAGEGGAGEGGAEEGGDEEQQQQQQEEQTSLLEKLLPGAPASLADDKSEAAIFVNSSLYDPIASRLLETLIINCPGKIFKALYAHVIKPRLEHLLRNETATYSVMRALVRLSREDLVDAVEKAAIPRVEALVAKGRFNVLVTLFERCEARGATESLERLFRAVRSCYPAEEGALVRGLCYLSDEDEGDGGGKQNSDENAGGGDDDGEGEGKSRARDKKKNKDKTDKQDKKDKKDFTVGAKNNHKNHQDALADPPKKKEDLIRNGAKLATTLILIPGLPSQTMQNSLLSLPIPTLLRLATSSLATARFLSASLRSPPWTNFFHKRLVSTLVLPHAMELAHSESGGYRFLCDVASVPSFSLSGSGGSSKVLLPFFTKQSVAAALASHEDELRESWTGRKVWRAWRGDLWVNRRGEWVRWAKEMEPPLEEGGRFARTPVVREKKGREFKSTTVGRSQSFVGGAEEKKGNPKVAVTVVGGGGGVVEEGKNEEGAERKRRKKEEKKERKRAGRVAAVAAE